MNSMTDSKDHIPATDSKALSTEDAKTIQRVRRAWTNDDKVRVYDAHRFGDFWGKRKELREWKILHRALKSLAPIESVLDVPCGTGRLTRYLPKLGSNTIIGCDVSAQMVSSASHRPEISPMISWHQGDIFQLPFADDTFDVVMCIRLMQHIPSTTRPLILRELMRVSRKAIVVAYYHSYTLRFLTRKLRGKTIIAHNAAGSDVEGEARQAGLRVVRRFWKSPIFSSQWIIVMKPA